PQTILVPGTFEAMVEDVANHSRRASRTVDRADRRPDRLRHEVEILLVVPTRMCRCCPRNAEINDRLDELADILRVFSIPAVLPRLVPVNHAQHIRIVPCDLRSLGHDLFFVMELLSVSGGDVSTHPAFAQTL